MGTKSNMNGVFIKGEIDSKVHIPKWQPGDEKARGRSPADQGKRTQGTKSAKPLILGF